MKNLLLISMVLCIMRANADFALGTSEYHIDTPTFTQLTDPTVRCDGDNLFLDRTVEIDDVWAVKTPNC